MISQMVDGETGDPQANDEPVPMEEVHDVIFADPEPMDELEDPEEMAQDVDEEGEVAEVGLNVELDRKDNLRLYLDPELEFDSEDGQALGNDMDAEQFEF